MHKNFGLKYYKLACANIFEELEVPTMMKVQTLIILSLTSLRMFSKSNYNVLNT